MSRYRVDNNLEHEYLSKNFLECCYLSGEIIEIERSSSIEYSNTSEPTYIREAAITTYCMFDDTYDKKTMVKRGWMTENQDQIPLILNVPVKYLEDIDDFSTIEKDELDLSGVGHLIRIIDDLPIPVDTKSKFIVERSIMSADKTYFILACVPHRIADDTKKQDDGGIKVGSMLKPKVR